MHLLAEFFPKVILAYKPAFLLILIFSIPNVPHIFQLPPAILLHSAYGFPNGEPYGTKSCSLTKLAPSVLLCRLRLCFHCQFFFFFFYSEITRFIREISIKT